MSLRRSARGKRKAVDLAVCITPKKKKALGKAAAKEHGKKVVKQCLKNRNNWAKWNAKGSEKPHCLTAVPEIMDVDHLQELKDDVRPLSTGESVLRLLQQDDKKQEANELLTELRPGMTRPVTNFHLKVQPCYYDDAARANMPHFGKLVEAYEHAGCGNWFINLSPPSKILGEEMRLPTGPGSNAKKKKELGVKIGSNERHFSHRDWQLCTSCQRTSEW